MKKIEIAEVHDVLLGISKEVHRICISNAIPYYMLGGSMLGAVRHKGFIPWDDDMDFGIPRIYYDKFIDICNKDLAYPYKLLTYKNSDYVIFGYAKISNIKTIIYENYSPKTKEKIGINVDIFPLDEANGNHNLFSFNNYIRSIFKLQKLFFVNSQKRSPFKKYIALLLQHTLPLNKKFLVEFIEKKLNNIEVKQNKYYANYFGAWGLKELIPKEVFGEPVLYDFESVKLYGVYEYDKYLTLLYNDYWELPPLHKRNNHSNSAYII